MPLNIAGKPMSNGALAVGGGLIVAAAASFLPWQGSSTASGYVCSSVCTFSASHNAFGYWAGLVFFIALLAGIAFFVLRTFVGLQTVPPLPLTDATVYVGIGTIMLLSVLLSLVTQGGRTHLYATKDGFIYTFGPSWGIFIAMIAAAAVCVGGYVIRDKAHAATRALSS